MARNQRPNEGLKILVNTLLSKGKDCYFEDELKFDLINFRRYEIKLWSVGFTCVLQTWKNRAHYRACEISGEFVTEK